MVDKLKLRIDPKLQNVVTKLTKAQYQQLKEDIKARGQVLEPLDVTESGVILDGHNRWAIIQELKKAGIKVSYDVRPVEFGADHETAIPSFIRAVNLHRRHLTTEQKQKLIRDELKVNPNDANRKIAKLLGVDDKTIAAARKMMEASAEIPQSETRKGSDGRTTRPVPQRRLPKPETADEAATAASASTAEPETDPAPRARLRRPPKDAAPAVNSDQDPSITETDSEPESISDNDTASIFEGMPDPRPYSEVAAEVIGTLFAAKHNGDETNGKTHAELLAAFSGALTGLVNKYAAVVSVRDSKLKNGWIIQIKPEETQPAAVEPEPVEALVWSNDGADDSETARSGKDQYSIGRESASDQFVVRCNKQLIGYGTTLDNAKLRAELDHRKRRAH
jgi:ParB-like chromosome segregation protein Spo0J